MASLSASEARQLAQSAFAALQNGQTRPARQQFERPGHLPLIVPPGCALRVGNETRVVLLFEAWHEEISERERKLVSAMLASIDAYGGKKAEWD